MKKKTDLQTVANQILVTNALQIIQNVMYVNNQILCIEDPPQVVNVWKVVINLLKYIRENNPILEHVFHVLSKLTVLLKMP